MLYFHFPNKAFGFPKVLVVFLLLFTTNQLVAQLNVAPTKSSATYSVGETINFNVSSSGGGSASWVLKYDNYATPIASGTLNGSNVTYIPTEPGVIICQVTKFGQTATAAAAVAPFDIQPLENEPSDFDAFWNGKKAELAAIPIDPVVTFYQNNSYSKTYKLRLNNIDGRKVYGYLTIPNGSGPFPAMIEMAPYGNAANVAAPIVDLAERTGAITLSLSIHNTPVDQVANNAYEPDNYDQKDGNYFRWGILGAIRGIDYLNTRNDFNGTEIGLMGVSQGAGLACIIAGLDDRVKLLTISNPILCENAGLKYNRGGGFPNYINQSKTQIGTAAHEAATVNATRYYDAIFHLKKFDGVTYINMSYEDLVTPAASGFAALNQSDGKKIIIHSIDLGHAHPTEYFNDRQNAIRRVFPTTLTLHPFPYSSNDQGYWVDAGANQNVNGNSANLNATIKKNGVTNPNFNLRWRKISGPGNVSFSNQGYNTTANFSQSGNYVLEFIGTDNAQLNEQKYFTVSDRVAISVGSGGGNNTPPVVNLSTSTTSVTGSFQVNAFFSENVSGFNLNDLAITNGTVNNLNGSGAGYNFTVTPIAQGVVNLFVKNNSVFDSQGAANPSSSNALSINYTPPGGGGTGSGNCDSPTNLALNKPATQKSSQFNAAASRANDGNTSGNFWGGNSVSLTNWENQTWWEVDLGEVSEIKEIKIWNRTDCCSNFLSNYYILVSENPFSSTNLSSTLNQPGVVSFQQSAIAGTPSTISINENGRYVRVQLAGTSFLGLAEVEVFGCASSGSGSGGGTGGGNGGGGNGGGSGCTAPSNIAPNGTATQVNTISAAGITGSASKAIDGNTNGVFFTGGSNASSSVSATNFNFQPYWEIDLGAEYDIQEIKIWNRTDGSDKTRDAHVMVSSTPFGSGNLNAALGQSSYSNFFSGLLGTPSSTNPNTAGRYVRIQMEGSGYLVLAEVEIFGCPVNSTSSLIAQIPVLHFEAVRVDDKVELLWTTNTEPKNDFFQIEKSTDGVYFEMIGEVESQNDLAGFHFYQNEDAEPIFGKNYYRLLLTQKDGAEIYTPIFELEFDSNFEKFSLFPNPAQEELSLNLFPFLNKKAEVQIMDARGVLLFEKEFESVEHSLEKISLENFQNGLYLLTLKVEGKKLIPRQFMVSRLY